MGRGAALAACRFIVATSSGARPPRVASSTGVLWEAIQDEPVRAVDKAWMAMLLPLGIEKGKAFQPDERQQRILLRARRWASSWPATSR